MFKIKKKLNTFWKKFVLTIKFLNKNYKNFIFLRKLLNYFQTVV